MACIENAPGFNPGECSLHPSWMVNYHWRKARWHALKMPLGLPQGIIAFTLLTSMSDSSSERKPYHQSENISAAYQLRYHFGWYTHLRQPYFHDPTNRSIASTTINEVSERYGYHVLELAYEPTVVRCLMSTLPTDCPSAVTRNVKGALSARFRREGVSNLWSKGWFARSNGTVCERTIQDYIAKQFEHHRAIPIRSTLPVGERHFQHPQSPSQLQKSSHAAYENNVHFVLCVKGRVELLDEFVSQKLLKFWMQFIEREGWLCWSMSVLADHAHMLLGLPLDVPIHTAVFRLMNNAEHWFASCWKRILVEARLDTLFQPSYYAGTTGGATTAQIRAYLDNLA